LNFEIKLYINDTCIHVDGSQKHSSILTSRYGFYGTETYMIGLNMTVPLKYTLFFFIKIILWCVQQWNPKPRCLA